MIIFLIVSIIILSPGLLICSNWFTLLITHKYRLTWLHGFRHTHASLLFESGANFKDVQKRLGHANIQTTMNAYTHLTDNRKEATTEQFIKYVNF
ncbi:hypothetical protein DAT606_0432 [Melissococcus plutonius]|nr:hypothetical protein DAT585_0677 [Melissococcus plutonius]BBD16470.1 hypothetical protein DAT606_0432 [Melissococcus plutonius]BBP07024.1 hypothetical protein DAT1033_0432 [Melissococcus plutonius]